MSRIHEADKIASDACVVFFLTFALTVVWSFLLDVGFTYGIDILIKWLFFPWLYLVPFCVGFFCEWVVAVENIEAVRSNL
jgi:hypothetical protein